MRATSAIVTHKNLTGLVIDIGYEPGGPIVDRAGFNQTLFTRSDYHDTVLADRMSYVLLDSG